MRVRKAKVHDAEHVYALVNSMSHDGTLLPRPMHEVCENIRDFYIAETDSCDFLGCGALHFYGAHLAEVRSIVVDPAAHGLGAGAALMDALLHEAEDHGIPAVCCFTRIPDFFLRYGFAPVERDSIPDKALKDCQSCARYHCCDEIAMVRGVLAGAVPHSQHSGLVVLR